MVSGDWRSRSIRLAQSRRRRRHGIGPLVGPFDVLLRTRSIHSFGLQESFGWVAFDPEGRVTATGTLQPRRVIVLRGARFVLEQPAYRALPSLGAQITLQRHVTPDP